MKQLVVLFLGLALFNFSFAQSNIFPSTSVPAIAATNDGTAIEVGLKFRVTQAGYITGVRFYKGTTNTGTHIGHLWSSTGTKLGEATFIGETASGWQEVLFTTPVAVATGTTYVASYFSSAGFYGITNPYFTSAVVNGPLRALANGEDGGNGVYLYTAVSAFPNSTYQSSNYWVDIVFATTVGPDVTAPTVNITAPAAGTVSGTINVTANASDNIGVVGVQFLLNGANLGTEVLNPPYTTSWNTGSVANGTYTLTARARDAAGNSTTSAGVIVTVNNDTQSPTVSMTAPAAGTVSGTINVNANASDNVGVVGVQFLLNGANLGTEDVASPYSISWNTATSANGTYTLTARARDAAGNSTISTGVIVTVNNVPDTQAPTVNITAPSAGTVTGTINVTANASDNIVVAGVQFLLNGANLGTEDVASPYSISWNTASVANGTYTLTARARDGAGNNTTSAGVIVTVSNTSNLFVALPMNEGTGTTTIDISGNNHPGTLTNAATWGTGKYGQGINLDGTNDYVNIADHADFTLDPAQSYSWSGWVKNTSFKEWSTVWSQTLDVNNFFYFYAHTSTDPDGGPVTNGVSVYWWNGGGANKLGAHSSNNVLTLGQWSYIAVTYDASQPQNNRFTIYVNGLDVTVRTDVSSVGTLASINPTNVRVGSNQPFGEYLNGSVDEVRFYRRLLSAAEVQADMNSPLAPAPDLTAPTVSMTAPAAGTVLGTINVSANASDNVGVAGVQFLLNGVNLGTEDIVAPYSISWNTTTSTNGGYTLTARARDAAGNTTTSAGVIVTINNDIQSPTVNITAPAAGTVLGTINVSANAGDNVGVSGVQFLLDGNNLGAEDIASPYSISWNTTTIADGNHSLTAVARDAAGNSTTSAAVVVAVLNNPPDTQSPTVNMTAPAAGTVLGTINVSANASDNVGVVGVQFLLNGANLGTEDLSSPYSISWNTATSANGTYTLTARARDAAGNTTTSSGVIITINNDIQPPTVNMTAPAAGTVLGTINVSANASDNIGVVGVQFLLNGVNLGTEDVNSPYSISWNTATSTNGTYTLTALARDAAGNTATSAGVIVTINNDVQSPTVNITAPAAGTVLGTINVSANASDNIGVVGLQFLLNGTNLGTEDIAAPYSISWNTATVINGNYTLTALARDAAGNTATSSPVNVTVSNNNTLIAALNFNEGTGTTAADMSGNNHHGIVANAPTWVAGKYGQGLNLDGSNDYVDIADHADFTLDPAQNYTWSTWVKNNNFTQWGTVWSQTVNINDFFYFYAHTSNDPDGGPVTNGVSVYWWSNNGAGKVGVHTTNNVLTAGQWSHIAVTYNASQPQNNRFTIYVNGADVTVRTDVSSTGTLAAINPGYVRIGGNQPFGDYLNGSIDEVKFYRRLLSLSEVQADMNTPIATVIMPVVTPVNGATGVSTNTTVTGAFNVNMNAATISSSTVELRNASNGLVPASVNYNSGTRTVTLTPSAALANLSVYSAKIKGGSAGVKDASGNAMANDYTWSFTTAPVPPPPPIDGPGGPILVIGTSTNPFSRYTAEILRAEGLNEFAATDISQVTATILNNYDVVVLGEVTVTAAQVTLLTNWVNAGGRLIVFKPSSLLTPLLGISSASGTLTDRYLLVNTASGPGVGIVNQTIQFHGTANLHTLNGATSLATLYSSATTATSNPAVTTRNVGSNGGRAIAFTYDLARSIVYTRQGNPALAATETDGQSPIRPDDLFFPNYVDLNKVAIPQADEQQRLLANIIIQSNLAKKPLPRFWYMPNGYKAAVIFALDDHGSASGTKDIFDKMIANSTPGCSVDDWACLRATSWFYTGIPLNNNQALAYNSQGFEMGTHVQNGCINFSSFANLDASYINQLGQFVSTYPNLPQQTTHRFHCLVWSDWLTQAKVELSHGMRLSLDYYYWPPTWANGRPGMFTGSGMPMRFADTNGDMIDIYQGVSQLVNENGIDYTIDINTLLDNAIGSNGYYGFFGTHDDYRDGTFSDVAIASAKARNVPIVSAKQVLTWLDGRNSSSFGTLTWSNNLLSFNITAAIGAKNIRTMLPLFSATGQLISITMNGNSVAFTTQTIKGMQYAFFPAATGTNSYVANYGGALARTMQEAVTKTESALTMTESISAKSIEQALEPSAEKLDVKVMPNPSASLFNLSITSNDANPVVIRVLDVFGRLVEKFAKVAPGSTIKVGGALTSGTYFAEVIQGDQRKVVKMVKTN